MLFSTWTGQYLLSACWLVVCSPHICSPLHTIRHCLQTMIKLLVLEKNSVLRNVTNRDLHIICHRLQFSQICVATENYPWIRQKKFFVFVKRSSTRTNTLRKKFFVKRSQVMMNHSLHTVRVAYEFCPFVLFCHCSRIVCSRLVENTPSAMRTYSVIETRAYQTYFFETCMVN